MCLSKERGPSTLPSYLRGGRTGTHETGGPPTATASVQVGATDLTCPLHDAESLLDRLAAVEASIRHDRHRQPPAVLEAIARLWTGGATVPSIAARLGVSEHIVRGRLRRAGALEYVFRNRHRHVAEVFEQRGAELVAAYEAGGALEALSEEVGIHFHTLKRYLVSHGVAIRHGCDRSRKTLEQRGAELAAAYEAGVPLKALAAETGISRHAIRAYLIAQGIAIRHRGRQAWKIPGARARTLIAAYDTGATITALCAALGVSRETVRSFLVANGVTIRSSREGLSKIPASRAPELIAIYDAGASITALAAENGVCFRTLRRFLVAHGVRLRHDHGWYRRRGWSGGG